MAVKDMVFSAREMLEFKRSSQTLGEFVSRRPKRKPTEPELANAILRACCTVTGSDFSRALSRSRHREDVQARQFATYLLKRKVPEMQQRVLGKYYGRDHATAYHSLKEVRRIINPEYKDPFRELFFAAEKEVEMNLGNYVTI